MNQTQTSDAAIDRQYHAVQQAHITALFHASLIATNFGWSAGPDYYVSKCADITGAQCYLKTTRVNRRYVSVRLPWDR